MVDQGLFISSIFSTWQADNHRHMFRLSDRKMNLEFPSGQPLVSSPVTSDKSDVHAKGQGQRSKVKVTEVTTQLSRFRTVTPVWIHIWWWDDAYSLIMLRRGALLFFKVIRQISRSHGSTNLTQIGRFRTVTPVWIHQWLRNEAQSLK